MAEHTPGPWIVYYEGDYPATTLVILGPDNQHIATLSKVSSFADARLIAQAPRLLAALRSAVKIAEEIRNEWDAAPYEMEAWNCLGALSGNLPGYHEDIDEIHDAITAAEGEE
jgi:hypothetical protein